MSVVTTFPTRAENAILDAIRQIEGVPSYGCGTLTATATEAQGRQCAWGALWHWLQQTGGNLRQALAIYNAGQQGLQQNPNQTTVQVEGRTQLYGYGYADAVIRAAQNALGGILPGAAAAAASPATPAAPSSGGTIPGLSAYTFRVIVIVAAGVLIMFGVYGLTQRRRLELIK